MKPPICVAVADDHPVFRKGIVSLLKDAGYSVAIEAENGLDLINKMKTSQHLPDICVLDINMPRMNGYEAVLEIKKKWNKVKILIMSMFESEYCIIRMLRIGVNGFITKGEDADELVVTIDKINEEGFYVPRRISNNILNTFHQTDHGTRSKCELNTVEIDFLKLCCTDLTYTEIASRMRLNNRVVESLRNSLFGRLCANSRVELVMYIIRTGLIDLSAF